jgi:hypothetical protein
MPIFWNLLGLFCAEIGAWALAGWPALLLVFGVWAMVGSLTEMAINRLRGL